MAITVQYGPIAGALGLAQVAGAGQGFQLQSQRDLQALQIQNQMQQTANQYAESTVQDALARQELQARQAQTQQQTQQQQSYQNAQLQMDQERIQQQGTAQTQQNSQFQQEQKTREQQAQDIAVQRQQSVTAKTQRDQWLQSLTPEEQNIVNSGGHLPSDIEKAAAQQRTDNATLDSQLRYTDLLTKQRDSLQKSVDNPLSDLSDDQRSSASDKIKNLNLTIDGLNASTGSRLNVGGGQAAPQQPISAPAAVQPTSGAPTITPDIADMAFRAVGSDVLAQKQWLLQNWSRIMAAKQQTQSPQ